MVAVGVPAVECACRRTPRPLPPSGRRTNPSSHVFRHGPTHPAGSTTKRVTYALNTFIQRRKRKLALLIPYPLQPMVNECALRPETNDVRKTTLSQDEMDRALLAPPPKASHPANDLATCRPLLTRLSPPWRPDVSECSTWRTIDSACLQAPGKPQALVPLSRTTSPPRVDPQQHRLPITVNGPGWILVHSARVAHRGSTSQVSPT